MQQSRARWPSVDTSQRTKSLGEFSRLNGASRHALTLAPTHSTHLTKPPFVPYLVTLAYGDLEAPTLAQVVFLGDNESEDTRTVAECLLNNAKNAAPQIPRFDWTTLKVQGINSLDAAETTKLIDAASKGQVGVGRVSRLKLAAD